MTERAAGAGTVLPATGPAGSPPSATPAAVTPPPSACWTCCSRLRQVIRPVEHGQPPARSPGQGHQHRADNQGVYTEQIQRGSAERYTVSYDVWNYPFRHRQPGPYA